MSAKSRTDLADMPEPGAGGSGASVDEITDRILAAIWEHRLPPGTKLVEEKLAEVFGVSRTKVRLALGKLSHDSILTVEPNRGTFVSIKGFAGQSSSAAFAAYRPRNGN